MPVTLYCLTCGEPFSCTPSEARGYGGRAPRRFCSHRCRSKNLDVQAVAATNRTGIRKMKLPLDDTVTRMYQEGMTLKEIAVHFGANDDSVRMHLIRRGVPRRGPRAKKVVAWHQKHPEVATGEVARLYQEGQSLQEIADRFGVAKGTVSARLRAAGVQLRRSFFGSEMPYRCDDGHLVRSRYEQIVDDWLWKHRIAHAYEPLLPFGAGEHADFLAGDDFGDRYIEVWGISGSAEYSERRRRKLDAYEALRLPVISLYGRHVLEELDQRLAPLLARRG